MKKQVAATTQVANQQPTNLYITVNTYDRDNKQVGTRVVDQRHYGTAKWLQSHLWWAMLNGNTVEIMPANEAEVAEYVEKATKQLQAKHAA